MSYAKSMAVEKLKDKRWTRSDKLMQYRAILKLYERNRKLQVLNATKLKKKVARKLATLKIEVKTYREIINDISFGDKRSLHLTLLQHKDIQRALRDLKPVEVYDVLYEDNHTKEKQLNKLIYIKKKDMKKLFELQIEQSTLMDKIKDQFKPDYEKQNLTKHYQHFVSKYKAALSIQKSYQMILNAFKKDCIFYDYVINTLKIDQNEQSQLILKMTVKGQIWIDDLSKVKLKYKRMLEDVMLNMKERERTLEIAREQVKDLWAYIQSVIQVESDTDMLKDGKMSAIDKSLEKQLQNLSEIFDKVKASLLVRSYEELLSRLEHQVGQKECLAKQFNFFIQKRDELLNKISHADTVLSSLSHSVISTTGQYKAKKEEINKNLKEQKEKQVQCNTSIKSHGELLVNIKSALQTMLSMLVCVHVDEIQEESDEGERMSRMSDHREMMSRTSSASDEQEELKKEQKESNEIGKCDETETDALTLLSNVTRKLGVLYAMSQIELSKEKEETARDLYQSYISDYRSKLLLHYEDEEPTNISIEYDVVDDKIPTRADIKYQSRKFVETQQKL